MQVRNNKYIRVLMLLMLVIVPELGIGKERIVLKAADSLFAIAKYQEAYLLYKKSFGDAEKNNESL